MAESTHLHTCMLCEAVCGLEVKVDAARGISIRGDKSDPFSKGHLCPKAAAIPDIQSDPDRLRQPQWRSSTGAWGPIGWDDALREAGTRLARIVRQHGPGAVAIYAGNPTVHSYGALMGMAALQKTLRRSLHFSATSMDQLPHMLASQQMFGHQALLPIPDIDRTDFFLVIGGNPLVSNGSIMTAPDIAGRLEALRRRGGKLVVVDPRRTETAQVADRHLFIHPGADAYLLLALLHTIFSDGNHRVSQACDGLATLRPLVESFAPEQVAARVGMEPAVIRQLARDFAGAASAVCYGRVGACTQAYGGAVGWLLVVLNAVTGNLDRVGGAMFPQPAVDLRKVMGPGHFNKWRSRVRGLPEFSGELPVSTLAEEIDTPGPGQIRALLTFAGNPVLSAPNGQRLEKALAGLEYMVSVDVYRNETTRHADIILPTSFGLERDHYDIAFYGLAVRNAARYVPAACKPPEGVRDDYDVLVGLASHFARARGNRAASLGLRALRRLGRQPLLDVLLRTGPHRLSLRALRERPHGVDLGPLQPCLDTIMAQPRVQLAPSIYVEEIDRLLADRDSLPGQGPTLQLIGRRHLRSNNSWMHNSQRLVKGPRRCTLLMHPIDAAARLLQNGTSVQVKSRTGAVTVPLHVSDEIAPGVVSLPHGWGHHRSDTPMQVAQLHAGGSINDLTDEQQVDTLSGNAAFSGIQVTVSAADSLAQ